LPGSELEVKPLDDSRAPLVLRIENVYRHGPAYRYDLVYYALEPGLYDLRDYLRRKDGSSTSDLPALKVEVTAILPPGQILPNSLQAKGSPSLGGYRLALIVGGVLWVLVLLAILFVGRGKGSGSDMAEALPLTVADRLRPLIEEAVAGNLTPSQCAELERTLLSFWRRRLGLEDHKPAEAIAILRAHPDAGPMMVQLETWLHRPGAASHVDVAALLEPYQYLPADSLEGQESAPARDA
jgi:hypothetical protein